jgi:hypothetical protein
MTQALDTSPALDLHTGDRHLGETAYSPSDSGGELSFLAGTGRGEGGLRARGGGHGANAAFPRDTGPDGPEHGHHRRGPTTYRG